MLTSLDGDIDGPFDGDWEGPEVGASVVIQLIPDRSAAASACSTTDITIFFLASLVLNLNPKRSWPTFSSAWTLLS